MNAAAAGALAGGTAGVHAHRVIFIDLARALAVVLMVYGHTVSAVLAPEYRTGLWFDVWQFQRGLTSSLFLLLSGFAFSIATTRHWATHLRVSWRSLRRVRRFALFVLLGYALHFPVARFADLPSASAERWGSFLAVDVLQLIGVTFMAVQLLVLVTRSRRVFMVTTLLLAGVIVGVTPLVWTVDWPRRVPLAIASYLAPAGGSQFPVFPWAGFVLLGAGLGQLYARWGAAHLRLYAAVVLLLPGAVMAIATTAIRRAADTSFGAGPGAFIPVEFVARAGACLVLLSIVAYVSSRLPRLPHVFGAVAQETLLIYVVHLCVVYGSVWNDGLAQRFGATFTPSGTLVAVVALLLAMVVLAFYWNRWKHVRPRMARWTSAAAGALLAYQLL